MVLSLTTFFSLWSQTRPHQKVPKCSDLGNRRLLWDSIHVIMWEKSRNKESLKSAFSWQDSTPDSHIWGDTALSGKARTLQQRSSAEFIRACKRRQSGERSACVWQTHWGQLWVNGGQPTESEIRNAGEQSEKMAKKHPKSGWRRTSWP